MCRREAGRKTWTPVAAEVRKTNWKVAELLHRNEYNFRVTAHNKVGAGKSAELPKEIMAMDPLTVPSYPLDLRWSNVRAKSIVLSWKRPANDGGCVVTGYVVEMKKKDSPDWRQVLRHHEATTATVLGQTYGSEYLYRIAGVNRIGVGEMAETKHAILAADPLAPPMIVVNTLIKKGLEIRAGKEIIIEATCSGVPYPTVTWTQDDVETKVIESTKDQLISTIAEDSTTSLKIPNCSRKNKGKYIISAENDQGKDTVTVSVNVLDVPSACKGPWSFEDATNEAVTLYWKVPDDDGGSDIINYVLEMKEANKKNWNLVSSTVQSTKWRVSKLVEGKEYVFRVCAENKMGKSEWLETVPYVAKLPFDPPQTPEKPTVTDVTRKSMKIKWNEPQDGGSTIVGYWLEKKDSSSSRWNKACRELVRKTEFQLSAGLIEGTTYQFRVCAVNDAGSGKFSSPSDYYVCEDPVSVPSPPQKTRVEDTTKTSVTLEWDKPDSDGGDPKLTYIVEQCLSDGSWSRCNDKDIEATSFKVENLLEGVMYSFRIKAFNRGGESKPALVPETAAREMIDLPHIELDATVVSGMTVKAGKKFIIPVKVTGRPFPEVMWTKNGNDVVSERFIVKKTKDGFEAVVKSSVRADWGDYKIAAKNSSGTKSVTCHVNVHDVPGLVKDFKCASVSKSTITLKWHAPDDTGGLPVKCYHVEKRDMSMRAWLGLGTTDKFSKDVTNILENSTYSFRICAENEIGKSDFVETLPVLCQDPIVVPDCPENIRIDSVKDTNITLKWNQPRFDGGSKVSGYNVERQLESTEDWIACNSRLVSEKKLLINNLEKGKNFSFRVKAVNNIGESQPAVTQVIEIREPETAPEIKLDVGVKGNLQVRAGDSIYLPAIITGVPYPEITWTKGEEKLVDAEDIKIKSEDDTVTLCIKKSTRAHCNVYTVTANNAYGTKSARCIVIVEDVPSTPVNLQATKVTSESVVLVWNCPEDNGGGDILNYVVEKREGKSKNWTSVNTAVIDTKYRVTKLTTGVEYHFRVAGENKFGVGYYAETDTVIAKDSFDVPGPPYKPTIIEVTKTSMLVTWQPPSSDNGAEIEGYWLEMRDNESSRWKKVNRSPITKPPLLDSNYKITNLKEGLTYRYRVCAINKAGSGPTSEESNPVIAEDPVFPTKAPATPEIGRITDNSISLKIISPAEVDETYIKGYVVEYQDDITNEWEKVTAGGESLLITKDVTVPDLKTGFRYQFRVAAVNKAGNSEYSRPTSFIQVKEQIG